MINLIQELGVVIIVYPAAFFGLFVLAWWATKDD